MISEKEMGERVDRVWRSCSPRLPRPTLTGNWEAVDGDHPMVFRKGDLVITLVECYKHSEPVVTHVAPYCGNPLPSGGKIMSAGTTGFFATIPTGSVVQWKNRFGKRFEASEAGVREIPDANNVF